MFLYKNLELLFQVEGQSQTLRVNFKVNIRWICYFWSLRRNQLVQQKNVSNRFKSLIKNRPRTQFNPFWTHVRSSDLEETQLTLEHKIWMVRDKSRRTWFLRKFQIDMSGSSWWAIKRYNLGHENPLNLVLAICEFLTSHTCHSHISHIYYRTCSFMVWLIINYFM